MGKILTAIPCSIESRELVRTIKEENGCVNYDEALELLIKIYEDKNEQKS